MSCVGLRASFSAIDTEEMAVAIGMEDAVEAVTRGIKDGGWGDVGGGVGLGCGDDGASGEGCDCCDCGNGGGGGGVRCFGDGREGVRVLEGIGAELGGRGGERVGENDGFYGGGREKWGIPLLVR